MNQVFVIIVAFVLAGPESMQEMRLFPAMAAEGQISAPPDTRRNVRSGYVGNDACRSCHSDKVNAFHQTAHYLTSMMPSEKSILGKFTPGDNILKTSNPDLFFRMDEKSDGFFQTGVAGLSPHTTSHSERFDLVIGLGEKGQTYLYWKEDQLFQLPVSYWTDLGWVNSPGYRDGFADFSRPIIPRCLECHATYFEALPPLVNRYSTAGFSLGIQCEKCHGPGREHMEQEKSGRTSPTASAILNPAQFSRDRQLDLCAWCHASPGQPLLPAFSYLPGEPLDRYIAIPQPDPDTTPDVHGNQVAMLKRSRCFLSSNMTCFTCHDVHRPQHDLAEFSQHCRGCHKPDSATFARADHHVSDNCIDCHMPRQDTDLIVFDWKGRNMRPQIRNHWIKVYADLKAPVGNG